MRYVLLELQGYNCKYEHRQSQRNTQKKNANSNKRSWCNYPHLLLSQIQRRSQQDATVVRAAHATISSTINPYASLYIHTPSINSPKLYFNLSFINFISISLSISPSSHWEDYPICIEESITLLFLFSFSDSNEWREKF